MRYSKTVLSQDFFGWGRVAPEDTLEYAVPIRRGARRGRDRDTAAHTADYTPATVQPVVGGTDHVSATPTPIAQYPSTASASPVSRFHWTS